MTARSRRQAGLDRAAPAVFARAVVGVDGTERGFEALRQTLVLAPAESSITAITALNTRPAIHAGFQASYWAEALEEEAAAARAEAAALLAGRPGSTARVVKGPPVDVLGRASDEADATLLALGGKQRSRLLGIMLGDTATELLHRGARSVLVARSQPDRTWRPRAVVVGVDGSDCAAAALQTAEELGTRLGSAVEVVSATDAASVRSAGDWTNRVDSWDNAHPVAALVERSRDVDLVVVGSRGVHGLRAIGSVSERVAHRARCSVLVVDASVPPASPQEAADAG